MSELKMAGVIGLLSCFLLPGCLGGCYGLSQVKVSDGYRDVTIRKVSDTGLIWKTTEAEGITPGTLVKDPHTGLLGPETFRFTVRDPGVAEQLKKLHPDQRIRVYYERRLTVWTPNGETPYILTGIEQLP